MSGGRLPWIRLFTEARNDRKLDLLTDDEFRVWFKLLCFSSELEPRGVFPVNDALAIEVANGDDDLLDRALARMDRLHLIELTDNGYGDFPAFASRQYAAGGTPSSAPDAVAERVRRYRETRCNAK